MSVDIISVATQLYQKSQLKKFTKSDGTAVIPCVIDHFLLMLCVVTMSVSCNVFGDIITFMPVLLCRDALLTISIDVIKRQILELSLVTFVLWT